MLSVARFRSAAIVLALLTAEIIPLRADDEHSYTLVSASATRINFADQHAQLGRNGFVTLSILTVLATSNVAYTISQVSINCSSSEIATASSVDYSAEGTASKSETPDPTAQPIRPETLGQVLQLIVCNGADPYPRSKAINDTAAAVAKAHELMAAAAKLSP